MVRQAMDFVTAFDPELGRMIEAEYKRQARNIELIASENIVSEAVMAAMGSVLTNKYAEGYPGKRYYGGCEKVDMVEDLARDRAASCTARSTPTCSPIPVPARTSARIFHHRARRHGARHGSGQRRPPDPRLTGQLLGKKL